MRSIHARLEKMENAAKDKLGTGATITFQDANGDSGSYPILGKESIVIIDDVDEDSLLSSGCNNWFT